MPLLYLFDNCRVYLVYNCITLVPSTVHCKTIIPIGKVIQVEGPDHSTPEAIGLHKLRLAANHGDVVEADPLVRLVGVGPHPVLRVRHHRPAARPDLRADFVVGQKPACNFLMTIKAAV